MSDPAWKSWTPIDRALAAILVERGMVTREKLLVLYGRGRVNRWARHGSILAETLLRGGMPIGTVDSLLTSARKSKDVGTDTADKLIARALEQRGTAPPVTGARSTKVQLRDPVELGIEPVVRDVPDPPQRPKKGHPVAQRIGSDREDYSETVMLPGKEPPERDPERTELMDPLAPPLRPDPESTEVMDPLTPPLSPPGFSVDDDTLRMPSPD